MNTFDDKARSISASISPRKRPLPASLVNEDEAPPPNKRLHTPTEEDLREKHNLYKRLIDEKNPVYMFPFLPLSATGFSPASPVYSFLQQQQQPASSSTVSPGSVLPIPLSSSSSASALNISGLPTPGGSSVGSVTPPRPTTQMFLKYPFSPPTPSSFSNLSLASPWSNQSVQVITTDTSKMQGSPKAKESDESKTSPKKSIGLQAQPAVSSSILSALAGSLPAQPCFLPGQSPLNYFSHSSPVSPMMYLNSPYAQSLSSVPSVSSSSGCSSSSDGAPGSVGSVNHSYAPSEYHVGPRRPLIEKIVEELHPQIESPSNSGRNTPIDVCSEDNTVLSTQVDSALLAQSLVSSSNSETEQRRTSLQEIPRHQLTPEPYLGGPSVNPQSYITHLADRPSSGVSSMSSSASSRDSTPEPEDVKHHAISDSGLFGMVPGRLSLLSSTQKYPVGVDEVRRRLSHPECLNASVLGGILRRAKSKNGGHVLRQRLEGIGLSLPPGRRKATDLSLFTSLVEGEALHLAKDFHRLCDNYFPCVELAQIIASQHTGTPEAQHRISMVKATQLILNELQAMVNAVGGPSNMSPSDPSNPYPGLVNFSLITHGFGNPAVNACLSAVQTYLKDLLSYYEGTKPVQPDLRCNRYPDSRFTSSLPTAPKQYATVSDARMDNEGRNRSGLFVCLKQEPSE